MTVRNMESFDFNTALLTVSNQLTDDQLDQMKFLCRDDIGKRVLEKISTGTKLFQVLSERGKLAADNTEYLSQRLIQIHRPDLADTLNRVRLPAPASPGGEPGHEERVKLDTATEVIVESLGKNWRRLGRKLGLTDVKLESISQRHPTDLEETAVELLKEWRKSRGAEARAEDLIRALRACYQNMTADKVESRLAAL